jgi:molybdate transport system regulatory protein
MEASMAASTAEPRPAGGGVSMALKLDVPALGGLGPGKIRLLELIEEHGSISAAGRSIDMSYRRAWDIVDGLNRMTAQPVVASQPGGSRGGGARLTPTGQELVRRYRSLQRKAQRAVDEELRHLDRLFRRDAG